MADDLERAGGGRRVDRWGPILARLAVVWLIVTAASFAYMAITFEPPNYVQVEGYGKVPANLARDLKHDGCLDDDKLVVCSAAWSKSCENRRCLLGDAAGYGSVAVLAVLVFVAARFGWRRGWRGRVSRRPEEPES